jgi:hypothetical protein
MWVYVTTNVPLMYILYAIPCEVCFVGEEHTAAKAGIYSRLSKEPLAEFLVWAKIKQTFEYAPIQMVCKGTPAVDGEPTTLPFAPRSGGLYSTNAGMGIILCTSQYTPLHINCSYISSSFAVHHSRAESTGLRDVRINGVERAWIRSLRIHFRVQPYSCCTITTRFAEV